MTHLDKSTTVKLPGGAVGFPEIKPDSPVYSDYKRWQEILNGEDLLFSRDPDFITAFINSVPNQTEQKLFLQTTLCFLRGESVVDLDHVLVFRRSLPSTTPVPEEHWTTDYIVSRNGLNSEIIGAMRLHSHILVSTFGQLSRYGFAEDIFQAPSDGEYKIISTPVDQQLCLTFFRPHDQQIMLDEYLSSGGMPIHEIRQLLNQKHSL